MALLGKCVAVLICWIVGMGILLGMQWLGWYGPEWLMWRTPDEGLILSPVVWVPGGIAGACFLIVLPIAVCSKTVNVS